MFGLSHNMVELKEYTEEWADLYHEEKLRISDALTGQIFEIQHIGSTAVKGMSAKPIIDIMVGINDKIFFDAVGGKLETLGYDCLGDCGRPERIFFVKNEMDYTTHHLHLVMKDSCYWTDNLLFRDYLLNNLKAADEYKKLKQDIARRYPDSRMIYRIMKSEYVQNVIDELRQKR